jgi:hypothetical protein
MSEVKVNKISPRSGTDVTLGDSGDTFTIPSGATINNQGTAVNFGATGSASWVTTVKTATFTATAGEGYFCNTTAGVFTVNLPAGTAGAVVAVKDYAGTFDNNNLTIAANGSDKIGGLTDDVILTTEGIAVTLVFIDSTQGWLVTDSGLQSEVTRPYTADFLVIAGGGSGSGNYYAGGGGAGGYRNSFNSETSGGGGSSESATSFTGGTVYTITVGAGAAAGNDTTGFQGSNSLISGTGITTITSTGGGAGARFSNDGGVGGSGGGASGPGQSGGAGTTNQGFAGGNGASGTGGGGGGAGAVGANAVASTSSGNGGTGVTSNITASGVVRAGGGGGASDGSSFTPGTGGNGGGGNGGNNSAGGAGTVNTGSGGGGGSRPGDAGGTGGSGVVILRMATSDYSGTTSGSPTISTSGSDTILVYNSSGSYTG